MQRRQPSGKMFDLGNPEQGLATDPDRVPCRDRVPSEREPSLAVSLDFWCSCLFALPCRDKRQAYYGHAARFAARFYRQAKHINNRSRWIEAAAVAVRQELAGHNCAAIQHTARLSVARLPCGACCRDSQLRPNVRPTLGAWSCLC